MTAGRKTGGTVILAVVFVLLAVLAWSLLWTTFMVYDDEGYVLYSLREFSRHGHLYDDVYSQYGPFFYLFYRALNAVGLLFTSSTGRALALVCWLGSAAACAGIVWRQTRGALVATTVTLIAVVLHLWPMIKEPSHPGGLIALLTAVAAWSATHPRWSPRIRGVILGSIAAMLALTKINIGVFFVASLGVWWVMQVQGPARRPWIHWLLTAAVAALPFMLMGDHLAVGWVRTFTIVTAVAAVAVVAAHRTMALEPGAMHLGVGATAAAVVTTGVVVALTLCSGTTVEGLVDGIIRGPLHHPSVYLLPFPFPASTLLACIATVPVAVWCARQTGSTRFAAIAIVRIVVVCAYGFEVIGLGALTGGGAIMGYGLLATWAFVLPLRQSEPIDASRSWLALLLVFQVLHAFPVAGSQVAWGTFLWVPLAAIAVHELGSAIPSTLVRRVGAATALLATALAASLFGKVAYERLLGSDELGLAGAEHLRLPESFSSALRLLVRNADRDADILFTLPGMMSFNLWTGIAPPTEANATHWFNLLSAEQQRAILQRLQANPRSVVIVQRTILRELDQEHLIPNTPLIEWLRTKYAPVFSVASYEFWAPKDRTCIPVGSARLLQARDGGFGRMIELVIDAGSSTTLGGIQVRKFVGNGSIPVAMLTSANSRVVVCTMSDSGNAVTNPAEKKLPTTMSGLVRIQVFTTAVPADFPATGSIAYLYDPTGVRFGEARFIR